MAETARTGLPVTQTAPAALIASITGAFITAPFDLLTVRAQVASSPAAARLNRPSLWTGVGYNLARIPLFALARAASFQAALSGGLVDVQSGSSLAVLAVASHATAVAVTHPLDTLKTIRMAQVPRAALWAGLPIALSIACVAEASAAFAYSSTLSLRNSMPPPSAALPSISSPPTSYTPAPSPTSPMPASPFLPYAPFRTAQLWSAAAVLCAVTLATHPLDTLKRRVQTGVPLRNALQRSLYAGLPLALIRGFALAGIQVALYEPLLHFTAFWLRMRSSPS